MQHGVAAPLLRVAAEFSLAAREVAGPSHRDVGRFGRERVTAAFDDLTVGVLNVAQNRKGLEREHERKVETTRSLDDRASARRPTKDRHTRGLAGLCVDVVVQAAGDAEDDEVLSALPEAKVRERLTSLGRRGHLDEQCLVEREVLFGSRQAVVEEAHVDHALILVRRFRSSSARATVLEQLANRVRDERLLQAAIDTDLLELAPAAARADSDDRRCLASFANLPDELSESCSVLAVVDEDKADERVGLEDLDRAFVALGGVEHTAEVLELHRRETALEVVLVEYQDMIVGSGVGRRALRVLSRIEREIVNRLVLELIPFLDRERR